MSVSVGKQRSSILSPTRLVRAIAIALTVVLIAIGPAAMMVGPAPSRHACEMAPATCLLPDVPLTLR